MGEDKRKVFEKENQTKRKEKKDPYGISDDIDFFACSSMDCTGLIPAGNVTGEEWESYEELYPSLAPPVISKREE